MNAEIVVVGAGPAGMAAAVRARERGRHVLVVDDNPAPGGQIWRGGEKQTTDAGARLWLSRFRAAAVELLSGAQVIAADAETHTLVVETADAVHEISFRKLVIAAGSREIFLPFPGWTLPGVMGAGGLQALAKSGLEVRGKRIVVGGSGPLLLAVAAYLRKHGAQVSLIAEQAPAAALAKFTMRLAGHPEKLMQAARLQLSLAGIPYRTGCWVEAAEGHGRLERVRVRQANKVWTEACDFAAVAYGLTPNIELANLLGCRMNGSAVSVDEFGRSSIDDVLCAGECTGIGGVDLSLIEGEIAGYTACGQMDQARRLFGKRQTALRFAEALNQTLPLREELRALPQPDTLVCRCEDVSFERLKNYSSFRAAKLHTRCGMGSCQGRVCGAACHFLFGWRTDSVRPPIFPARMGSLVRKEGISEEALITK